MFSEKIHLCRRRLKARGTNSERSAPVPTWGGGSRHLTLPCALPGILESQLLTREGADGRLAHLDYTTALQLSRLILVHLEKEGLLKTSCEELKTFSWGRVISHRGELLHSQRKIFFKKEKTKQTKQTNKQTKTTAPNKP